ncbi:MAG: hypothetical protein WC657_00040 [Candidatus Paceibacterota bacterium]|jgi:hypothetical protein
MKRNILLIIVLIVLSSFLAIPIANGIVYKMIFNNYGSWFVTEDFAHFANGFPFTYLFLSTFLFGLFGKGRKWLWSVISVIPVLYFLYYIESGTSIWLWSAVFFVSGIIVAKIMEFISSRVRTSNPPMVVK